MAEAVMNADARSSPRITFGPRDFLDFSGRTRQSEWTEAVVRDSRRHQDEQISERRRRLAEQKELRRVLDAQVAMKRGLVTTLNTVIKQDATTALEAETKDDHEVDAHEREIRHLQDELAATARLLHEEISRVSTPRMATPAAPQSHIPQPWNATMTSAAHPLSVDRSSSICRNDSSPRHLRSTERVRTSHGSEMGNLDTLKFDGYTAYVRAREVAQQRSQIAEAVAPQKAPLRELHGAAILPPALTSPRTCRSDRQEAMRMGLDEQLRQKKVATDAQPEERSERLMMYDRGAFFGCLTSPQTPNTRQHEQESYRRALELQMRLQRATRAEGGFLPIVVIKPSRPQK